MISCLRNINKDKFEYLSLRFLIIFECEKMAITDFDGTLRRRNAAYDFAVMVGREKEAKELYFNIHSRGKEIIGEEKNQSHLIKKLDMLYQSLLQMGSSLLQGIPTSRISQISYQPTPQLPKIVEIAEKEGSLDIGTLTHEGFAENFIEVNKEKLPACCKIVSASKLKENNGFFTGEIERFSGIETKMHSYRGGSVFANSITDVGICIKASESRNGDKIYVIRDNDESVLSENAVLEDFLEKSEIPFSYL